MRVLTVQQRGFQLIVFKIPQMLAKPVSHHCSIVSYVCSGVVINILSWADAYVAVARMSAADMIQSSILMPFVISLVANLDATNMQTVAYTVVSDANNMPDLDLCGKLQSSALTFAVPIESAMVQLASIHAAVL